MRYSLFSVVTYVVSILMIVLGLWAIMYNYDFEVSAGGTIIVTAVLLAMFAWAADKIIELEHATLSPPPLEESRKVPAKTPKEVFQEKFRRNPKEIQRLQKIIDKPPPPLAPDWAKFTVAFMTGISKLWGELKLLIVGAVCLWMFLFAHDEWFSYDYGTTQTFQLIMLLLGSFAVWRWVTNNARWEPKPLSGGRWVALVLVAIIVGSTVIAVFAIIYMPQLIQLLAFLRG